MIRSQVNSGIRFQFSEVLVVCGTAAIGAWELQTLGMTMISLGILSSIMRFAVEAGEKAKFAEAKQGEAQRLREATSSLAEAFSGFGKPGQEES